jgi:hypothetical protein
MNGFSGVDIFKIHWLAKLLSSLFQSCIIEGDFASHAKLYFQIHEYPKEESSCNQSRFKRYNQ